MSQAIKDQLVPGQTFEVTVNGVFLAGIQVLPGETIRRTVVEHVNRKGEAFVRLACEDQRTYLVRLNEINKVTPS